MNSKNNKYKIILLWGVGMYAFQKFLSDPQSRLQIVFSILISFLIYSANEIIMTDAFYKNKYLRHFIPLLIMNLVLIPINLIYTITNSYKYTTSNYIQYIIFNICVLVLYILQHHFYKKGINKLLTSKISSID